MGNIPAVARPFAIFVIGVSGSGKTTVSKALAELIGCPQIEGDLYHAPASIAKMAAGIALNDDDRWPWLDRIGEAVNSTIAEHGIGVASCSALKHAYRDRLRHAITSPVCFVLLDSSREELLRRLSERKSHYMPASLLGSQLDTLERPAPEEGVLTLDGQKPPEAICQDIIAWIQALPPNGTK